MGVGHWGIDEGGISENRPSRFLRAARRAVALVEALAEGVRSLRLDEEGDDLGMGGADALLQARDDGLDLGRGQVIGELEA